MALSGRLVRSAFSKRSSSLSRILKSNSQTEEECTGLVTTTNQICKCAPLLSPPKVYFHHQNIIQIQIQTSHGILLDALQKSRNNASELKDLKIPDEIKRVKAGSLKWLFAVWSLPKQPFSALSKVQKNVLQGQETEAKRSAYSQDKDIQRPPDKEDQLHRVLDYLKGKGVPIRRLVKLPWLLTSSPEVLEGSAKRVKKLLQIEDFQVAICFVNISEVKLKETAFIWRSELKKLSKISNLSSKNGKSSNFENRVEFMAYHLQCPPADVAEMMARVNKLMTMPIDQINDILMCLLEADVKPEFIISDPWVFQGNVNALRARMQTLKDNGISEYKPWVLRCSHRRFELYNQQEISEMQLLGKNEGICGFLQEKLNCSKTTASTMLVKVPSIKPASATKLNEMIEFLYSAGFNERHIIETPRILAHSVETISERLEEVSKYEPSVVNLQVLCRTSKEYRAIVRKLKRDTSTTGSSEDCN